MTTCQRVVLPRAREAWQVNVRLGKCPHECVPGTNFCVFHTLDVRNPFAHAINSLHFRGNANRIRAIMATMKGFRSSALQEIYEEIARDPNQLDLSEELRTVRVCAAGLKRLALKAAEKNNGELSAEAMAAITAINKDVVAVGKQVAESNDKLSTNLTIDDAHVFAEQFSNIIIKNFADSPNLEQALLDIAQVFAPTSEECKKLEEKLAAQPAPPPKYTGFQAVVKTWMDEHPNEELTRTKVLELRKDYALKQIEILERDISDADDQTAYTDADDATMSNDERTKSAIRGNYNVPGVGRKFKIKLEEVVA